VGREGEGRDKEGRGGKGKRREWREREALGPAPLQIISGYATGHKRTAVLNGFVQFKK